MQINCLCQNLVKTFFQFFTKFHLIQQNIINVTSATVYRQIKLVANAAVLKTNKTFKT